MTCATGDSKLAKMTGNAVRGLKESAPVDVELKTSVVLQDCPHEIWEHVSYLTFLPKNKGFAAGMNRAIEEGLRHFGDPDIVLCFNNDLEFPDRLWLRRLIDIAEQAPSCVTVPATDRTALYKQAGPENRPSFTAQEASAYCWLVPWAWCKHLKETYGWWLFDPEFFAFGEDNKTAFLLSKAFGPKVFRMVPRAFVRHLRHQTTGVVKPNRRESSRILKRFFQQELEDPSLRSDLRAWAQRYVKVLRT